MRIIAQDIRSGDFLDWDVPLSDVTIEYTLSGPTTISGSLEPEVPWLDIEGYDMWRTWLHVEDEGVIRASGIIQPTQLKEAKLEITAEGASGYPHGLPYRGDYKKTNVDPLDAFRHIWDHVQSYPDGDLGVQVDSTATLVKIGTERDSPTLRLDIGADENGRQLWEWPDATHDNQLFKLGTPDSDGYRTITSKRSGRNVSSEDDKVVQFGQTGSPYQLWKLVNHGTYKTIKQKASGKVMDASGNGKKARIYLYGEIPDDDRQHWEITDEDDDGYVHIENVASGERQPYELHWWDNKDCGSELNSLADDTPVDYRDHAEWNDDHTDVHHRIEIGWPRLGAKRDNLIFAMGENIVDTIPMVQTEDHYASEVTVLGAGQGRDMIHATISDPDPNRVRRAVVVKDKTITRKESAKKRARNELRRRQAYVSMQQITVDTSHRNAPLGTFSVGDDIRVRGTFPWIGRTSMWHRIVSYTWSPGGSTVELELEPSQSFRYGPWSKA